MKVLEKLESKDGSVKFLLELEDSNTIEALYMRDQSNTLTYNCTVCISSQVGCNIGCKFCATGSQGFVRNLTADEIAEQVALVNKFSVQSGAAPIKAVVFAGMGEPLLNYENVKTAIEIIHKELGIKDFELATSGVVPSINKMIHDFKDENLSIRLNLSLHASNDNVRSVLIPYNSVYNIDAILEAAAQYAKTFNTKVRVRYMLIKGLNDSELDIARLCRLLENKPFKLVVSSYNDNHINGLAPVAQNEMMAFYNRIKGKLESDLFYNFGEDIQGGCGQLRQHHTVNPAKHSI